MSHIWYVNWTLESLKPSISFSILAKDDFWIYFLNLKKYIVFYIGNFFNFHGKIDKRPKNMTVPCHSDQEMALWDQERKKRKKEREKEIISAI